MKIGDAVMVMVAGGALVLGEITGIEGDSAYVYLFLFEQERIYTLSQLGRWNRG